MEREKVRHETCERRGRKVEGQEGKAKERSERGSERRRKKEK